MHLTSTLTSIITNSYHYHGLFVIKFLREHGTYNVDFRYLMLTSYTHDFKCQTLNDSSKPLQSITYGFDHMTTNLDVNFFLWHQSAWVVLRKAVKINTKEECVLNIALSSMILYCLWWLDQLRLNFITVWTKPEKLRIYS
jgi:hypothetical protein